MQGRERLSSRIGFILVSAGCAIGLGNVWRFPYIAGRYGGAAFVLLYILFLAAMGVPIMTMEFSVGRASRRSAASSYRVLEPKGTRWHLMSYIAVAGNYMIMMFYTTIAGWILYYAFKMAVGELDGVAPDALSAAFNSMRADPYTQVGWMLIVVLLGFGVCAMGLKRGVERITKFMMSSLFIIMAVLCARSVTLPGAGAGLRFYLVPDFGRMVENGLGDAIFAAMGQAFFTLSLGVGTMAMFGSYIGRERSLTGESVRICALDTLVALMAGLIIFPACFAFGVNPGEGPGLVFVTIPNIFNQMSNGRLWGTLFFIFMSFAALSTVIAVFENIINFGMELRGWTRRKAVWVNVALVFATSLPCALGFNLLSRISPFGPGTYIQDLEDFMVSNNLLPLGALMCLMFCTHRCGWGWDNYMAECNAGKGMRFPAALRCYVNYVLPLIMIAVFIYGYIDRFGIMR